MRISLIGLMLAAATIAFVPPVLGQDKPPKELYVYPQHTKPEVVDNYLFNIFYSSGRSTYNLADFKISSGNGPVVRMKVSPAGTSYAVLEKKKSGETLLNVYNLWKAGDRIFSFKDLNDISDIVYSHDGRFLVFATPGKVTFVDANTFKTNKNIYLVSDQPVAKLSLSKNGRYLAAARSNRLNIYDVDSKIIIKPLVLKAEITDMAYCQDGEFLAVLTSDGVLSLYDATTYLVKEKIEGLGSGSSFSFTPDERFVAVLTSENRIAIVNRLNPSDRNHVEFQRGGLGFVRFVNDNDGNLYLVYTTDISIIYKLMNELDTQGSLPLKDRPKDRPIEIKEENLSVVPGDDIEESAVQVNVEIPTAEMDTVPFEVFQQARLEEAHLQSIMNGIISLAKQQEKITDHAHFYANTSVLIDKDRSGRNITNYQIEFSYDVDPEFEEWEDYGSGKYRPDQSPAASVMLEVIKRAIENDFADYVKQGRDIMVNISVKEENCPKDKDRLALLRAYGVRDFLADNVKGLDKMNTDYHTSSVKAGGKDGNYRVKVLLTFAEAFN